jgi:hypothetical protein
MSCKNYAYVRQVVKGGRQWFIANKKEVESYDPTSL